MAIDETERLIDDVLSVRRLRRKVPSYTEFARTITHYAGPKHVKGTPYKVGSCPHQAYLLQQMDSGRYKRIFVCAPPQFGGKTIVGVLIPALRNLVGARLPVGYGLPTLADLDKAWAEKVRPAMKGSGYGDHLPTSGPGARGGRGQTVQLHDPETGDLEGMLVWLAGGGYGSTVAAAIIDEIDQFRTSAGEPLWGAIEDIFARANAYGANALRIGVGTVEDDERSIILPLIMDEGTGTVPWLRCPDCRNYHRLTDAEHVVAEWDDEQTAAESARIACPTCGVMLDETGRQLAVRQCLHAHKTQTVTADGTVVGPHPRTDSLGLWWDALSSPFANLGDLARRRYRAQQAIDLRNDHEPMRKYVRYVRCQVYVADKVDDQIPHQITRGYLVARSTGSPYRLTMNRHDEHGDSLHLAEPPRGMEFLVAGVDVQRGGQRAPGRLYVSLGGGAADRRVWDLAWGHIIASPVGRQPTEAELHAALDRCHALLIGWAQDYGLPIVRRGLDVGDRQDELCRWLRRRSEWWAVKGTDHTIRATQKNDIPGVIYHRQQEGNWWLRLVDSNQVRRDVQAGYLVPPGKPGAHHVPQGLDLQSTWVRHLCATALIPDGRNGIRWSDRATDRKHHPEWQIRRDLLDTNTYRLALMLDYLNAQASTSAFTPISPEAGDDDYAGAVW